MRPDGRLVAIVLLGLAGTVIWRLIGRDSLRRIRASVEACSASIARRARSLSGDRRDDGALADVGAWTARHRLCRFCRGAELYDAAISLLVDPLYARLAEGVVGSAPSSGRALDVGCGPGHLAAHIARRAPGLEVVGVDLDPTMVELAARRARRLGLSGRLRFQIGDAAALPFPDASFDVVTSTFSLHHWQEPVAGLAEIRRVLKPGATATVYDVADWIRRLEVGGPSLAEVVAASPFPGARVEAIHWPGPLVLALRVRLR